MPESPLQQALRLLTYGVYVVTAQREGQASALLTPWLSQVTLSPPMLAVSVPISHPMHEPLTGGAPFVVNVLRAGQKTVAEDCARDAADAFRGHESAMTEGGIPYLSAALAIVECEPAGSMDTGRGYTLVLGTPTAAAVLADGQPLTLRQTGMEPPLGS